MSAGGGEDVPVVGRPGQLRPEHQDHGRHLQEQVGNRRESFMLLALRGDKGLFSLEMSLARGAPAAGGWN